MANSPDSYEKGRQDGHAYAGEVYFRNMIAAGLMKLLPFPTMPFTPPGGLGGTGGSSLELSSSGLSVAGFPVAIDPIADPALYEFYERILRAQTNAENDRRKARNSIGDSNNGVFKGVDESKFKDTVEKHVFSNKHMKAGIMDLGDSKDYILDEGIKIIKRWIQRV